jgi:pyruvate decarboxylase
MSSYLDDKFKSHCFAFSSVGYSLLWSKAKCITVQPDRVTIGETASFGCILMKDFLEALAQRVEKNTASLENFMRMHVPSGIPLKQKEGEPIKVLTLFKHIQVVIVTSADMLVKFIDGYTYDIPGPKNLFQFLFSQNTFMEQV